MKALLCWIAALTLALLFSASPAAAVCAACGCECNDMPCGCWCKPQTGFCECFQCGPALTGGSQLSLMDLPNGQVGACLPLANSAVADLAKRAGGTPVYFGGTRTLDIVKDHDLRSGRFSKNLDREADLNFSFTGLDAPVAVRIIAEAAHLDIVVPSALQGKISAHLTNVSWEEALRSVIDATGADLEIVMSANGLAWLKSSRTENKRP